MWSPDLHCFIVQGEQIPFTAVEDMYFLTGLPFRGTPLPTKPVLPRDTSLATVGQRYYSGHNYMSKIVVSIRAMDALAHHFIATMIVRVYGSLAMKWISSG